MTLKSINQIAIVGGTHGNELTGVYFVKKAEKFPNLIQRSNFKIFTLLANPKAFEIRKRYVDIDLNRCFKRQDLDNPNLINYDQIRAKEIDRKIQTEKVDFIIDLHSTTAKMGVTIILNNDHPFLLGLSAYLSAINPLVKVLQYAQSTEELPYIRGLCELGLAIEVGSIAQNVLDAELFLQTEATIHAILDYVELYNQGKMPEVANTCLVYQQIGMIDYPRDEKGEIKAMIHPQLQDYEPLKPGMPIFLSFEGEEITYQDQLTVYPVFIGEAAYMEKGIAMCLTSKKEKLIKGN